MTGTANVDLQNDGNIQTFVTYAFNGPEKFCGPSEISHYDPVKQTVIYDPINDALLSTATDCDGGPSFLTKVDGKTYIEDDHNPRSEDGDVRGIAIYEIKDNHAVKVCSIVDDYVFTAQ